MSLQSSSLRAWNTLRQKACSQPKATYATSKPVNRSAIVGSFARSSHSRKALQQDFTSRSAYKVAFSRTYATESSDSGSNKSGNDKKVIKLVSGPNGGQRDYTPEELKDMLRESGTFAY